jgi:hypothetical protein
MIWNGRKIIDKEFEKRRNEILRLFKVIITIIITAEEEYVTNIPELNKIIRIFSNDN